MHTCNAGVAGERRGRNLLEVVTGEMQTEIGSSKDGVKRTLGVKFFKNEHENTNLGKFPGKILYPGKNVTVIYSRYKYKMKRRTSEGVVRICIVPACV